MQTRTDDNYRLTTLEDVKQDFLKNAKTNYFHLFRKRWLSKQWELYPELRIKVLYSCYKANLMGTETYMNLRDKLEGECNEQ